MAPSSPTILPLPAHYDPANAVAWSYHPDQAELFAAATAWRERHQIPPSSQDRVNVHLLLVDCQKDFCLPEGSLYVGGRSGRGAIEDNRRIAEFIYRNLARITNLTTTLDTHFAYQIFFPSFWIDGESAPINAFRTISSDQVRRGEVRPNPAIVSWLCQGDYSWLVRQCAYYCSELERERKYALYVWPPHCLLGSDGHSLAGVIHEARLFHSFVRGSQSWVGVKGDNPLTENYSVFRPEVLTYYDGHPFAEQNEDLLAKILRSDYILIAGQAASHCVKSTIDDLLAEMLARDPVLTRKVYILRDCTSAVAIPDGHGGFVADFTPEVEVAFERFQRAGMHVVRSTDPLESWPDLTF